MIKVGIVGYGNLGKGAESAVKTSNDMELVGVFTRREPSSVKPLYEDTKVYHVNDAAKMKEDIDVMILCGGSATDLIGQTPEFARNFNLVDSFDTHKRIPEHFANVDKVAKESGKLAVISSGWDPGLFSLNRLYARSILPRGKDYTFWGKGVSQGHSDALRRIDGVKNAIQYTIPVEKVVEEVRAGLNKDYTVRQQHTRLCYVVLESDTEDERKRVTEEIVNMPNYFSDYDTTVEFITEEVLRAEHKGLPHGGFVIRSGNTGANGDTKHIYEFSLKLESNSEFTSSVLIAYARAAYRLNKRGESGAKTVFEIAPADISPESIEDLRKNLL